MDVPPGLSHDGAAGDGRRRIPHDNGWLSSPLASHHPIPSSGGNASPTYLFGLVSRQIALKKHHKRRRPRERKKKHKELTPRNTHIAAADLSCALVHLATEHHGFRHCPLLRDCHLRCLLVLRLLGGLVCPIWQEVIRGACERCGGEDRQGRP